MWCAWIGLTAVTHLVLSSLSIPCLTCVFREYTGVPCPGCGLTHATLALLHGRWGEMAHDHVFAPIFLIALALISVAAVLPGPARQRLVVAVDAFEHRTAIMPLLAALLVIYWWFRLP